MLREEMRQNLAELRELETELPLVELARLFGQRNVSVLSFFEPHP